MPKSGAAEPGFYTGSTSRCGPESRPDCLTICARVFPMPTYGQFCSVARAHEVLGGRWTLLVVRELLCGSRRFNDIRRGIPRVSRTMLSERLQTLIVVGAIVRSDDADYTLTEAGLALAELVIGFGAWGQRWLTRHAADE